jgi:hypothetical protein
MPLSKEQEQKANAWLQQKNLKARCPACSAAQWAFGEIVMSPSYTPGGIAVGGPGVPELQIVCTNCAYVMHFAAIPMGLTQ